MRFWMKVFKKMIMTCLAGLLTAVGTGAQAGGHVLNESAAIVSGPGTWWVMDGGTTRLHGGGGALTVFDNLGLYGPLWVAPEAAVDVMGVLQNDLGVEGMVLEADALGVASLIHHQPGVEAILWRMMPAVADWHGQAVEWHTLSSPVVDQPLEAFVPAQGGYDLYGWSEPLHSWINFKQTGDFLDFNQGMDFLPGRGYLAAYELEQNFAFEGVLHALEVNGGQLTRSGPDGGWHLLGNPFASALYWNCSSWSRCGLNGEVHLWDRTRGNYVSNNHGLGDFSGLIPSQQAVFVRVAEAGKGLGLDGCGTDEALDKDDPGVTLRIPAGARRHDQGRGPEKQKEKWPERTLRLEVRPLGGAEWKDAVFVRLMEGAKEGFDAVRDAHKLAGMGGAPMLYARKGETDLSIGVFPPETAQGGLGLWFEPGSGDDALYVLSVQGPRGFDREKRLLLADRHTGQRMNLHEETSWVFGPSPSGEGPRFLLLYGERGNTCPLDGMDAWPLTLYAYGDALFVGLSVGSANGQLQVFGLDGRLRRQWQLEGEGLHRVPTGLAPGVYVARLLLPGQGIVGRRLWLGSKE